MPNTAAYQYPVTGATPPTAAQAKNKNMNVSTITGDNSATSIVVTHNWALTQAELDAGFPVPIWTNLAAGGAAANPQQTAKDANTITFTNVAFSGALLRLTLLRPMSMIR